MLSFAVHKFTRDRVQGNGCSKLLQYSFHVLKGCFQISLRSWGFWKFEYARWVALELLFINCFFFNVISLKQVLALSPSPSFCLENAVLLWNSTNFSGLSNFTLLFESEYSFHACVSSGGVSTVKHVASLLLGMYGLFLFFEVHMLWVLLLSALCYLVLLLSRHSSSRGLFLSAVILAYLLIGWVSFLKTVGNCIF